MPDLTPEQRETMETAMRAAGKNPDFALSRLRKFAEAMFAAGLADAELKREAPCPTCAPGHSTRTIIHVLASDGQALMSCVSTPGTTSSTVSASTLMTSRAKGAEREAEALREALRELLARIGEHEAMTRATPLQERVGTAQLYEVALRKARAALAAVDKGRADD